MRGVILRMRVWAILAAVVALLLLLRVPALTSAAWTNAGMLALRDGRLTAR